MEFSVTDEPLFLSNQSERASFDCCRKFVRASSIDFASPDLTAASKILLASVILKIIDFDLIILLLTSVE